MDADAARLAISPACRALTDAIGDYDPRTALAHGQELRDQGVSPELVAAAMTQARLRSSARAKFGEFAAGMAFTQEGLEQATRLPVAALHAERYLDSGFTRVADLTCGLGGDSMSFAALGLGVVAFESDEPTAILADHNLRHWPEAVVVHADSLATVRGVEVDAIFADPARRTARGRRHHPADYAPPLDEVLALRDRFPATGVKVGPGIPHDAIPAGVEAQWVSVDGDVVEAALWCGPLARHVGHAALVIHHGLAHELAGDTHRAEPRLLGPYIGEPDGAVIRAGLVGVLADDVAGGLVDPTIAYITADAPAETPFARWYRVLDAEPFSVKRLAATLRARGVGSVDIKKRGIDITPERLRTQLRLKGDAHAMVIITRVDGHHTSILVEPV